MAAKQKMLYRKTIEKEILKALLLFLILNVRIHIPICFLIKASIKSDNDP